MSNQPPALYIVATPIGNLADVSERMLASLQQADVIYAEDTRHTGNLLRHFNIQRPLKSCHEHNESKVAEDMQKLVEEGKSVALVSDAGTPLISDPGFPVVRKFLQQGLPVVPIPGPSAVTVALSVAGIATDRFCFEGFLPAKNSARDTRLQALTTEPRTLVFYESPRRIVATLGAMVEMFGKERSASLCRELTKQFETIKHGTLAELLIFVSNDENQQRGEFVVVVAGAQLQQTTELQLELDQLLKPVLAQMPLKQAVKLVTEISGLRKNEVYQRALELQADDNP